MKCIDNIDETVLGEFCNRKYTGRIDFVVDIDTKKFYPVPKDIEHKDFTPQLFAYGSNFVPVQMRLQQVNNTSQPYDLQEIIVGASSYEAETGARHYPQDLVKALNLAWELINRSQIINPTTVVRKRIIRKFIKKDKTSHNPHVNP